MKQTIKSYYNLTKPGIIYGNILSTTAGFLLASNGKIDLILFLATFLGTSFVIASACVFNNYIDREVDAKMKRTKTRALVTGKIPVKNALVFGGVLGLIGFLILALFTNWFVFAAGIIGFISYVWIYGVYKRKSPIGTLIGTIPGAMPLVAGYVAVANQIDLGAVLLFLIMVFWQLTHFYAIGTFRLNDYKEAGLPILPVKRGVYVTKVHMLISMILFLISATALSYYGYAGGIFMIVMAILSSYWIMLGINGFKAVDDVKWARKVFSFSILILMTMSILMSLNVVLP